MADKPNAMADKPNAMADSPNAMADKPDAMADKPDATASALNSRQRPRPYCRENLCFMGKVVSLI
jgi:hypothetical protein